MINRYVGLGLFALSGGLVVVGLLTVGWAGVAFGVGPVIGAVANIVVSNAWKSRARKTAGDTRLSGPLWDFLNGLVKHSLGPSYAFGMSFGHYYPVANSASGWRVAPKAPPAAISTHRSAREILDPRVFELLDAAAWQFNRVQGYLAHTAASEASPAREASRLQVAADQAMIDALTVAQTMQQFPENIDTLRPSIEACTAALKEAADLVGTMAEAKVAPAPKEQATLLRGMLEDLRIENLARSELNAAETEIDRKDQTA